MTLFFIILNYWNALKNQKWELLIENHKKISKNLFKIIIPLIILNLDQVFSSISWKSLSFWKPDLIVWKEVWEQFLLRKTEFCPRDIMELPKILKIVLKAVVKDVIPMLNRVRIYRVAFVIIRIKQKLINFINIIIN